MKLFIIFLFVSSYTLSQRVVEYLSIPDSINGYVYNKEINTYFRHDVPKKITKWVERRVKARKKIKSRSRYLSKKAQINILDEPNWIGYFGGRYRGLYFSVTVRIDVNGLPEIIIFNKGGSSEENRIYAYHILKSSFTAAVDKKGNHKTTWITFNKTYSIKK